MIGPCAHDCLRGHGSACVASRLGHVGFCEAMATGRADYAALVDRLTAEGWTPPVPAPSLPEEIAARRAAKPRTTGPEGVRFPSDRLPGKPGQTSRTPKVT